MESLQGFKPGIAKVELEQYETDGATAIELAFIAGAMHGDLNGRIVLDMCSGTGQLSFASFFFGATRAVCVEVDGDAMEIAAKNASKLNLEPKMHFILADALHQPFRDVPVRVLQKKGNGFHDASEGNHLSRKFTVLLNPPFGIQGKTPDLAFLKAAMEIPYVCVIYSLHLKNEKNRQYLKEKIGKQGWNVTDMYSTKLILPRLYDFQVKEKKEIEVDILRIAPGSG
ncbi:methyltransferase domain-containing protein [Candidatus Bathyarchaeota archaeon]|nr:methyltransferase domain-containing protein [Candidatus Bathyarchaeota archaeon]